MGGRQASFFSRAARRSVRCCAVSTDTRCLTCAGRGGDASARWPDADELASGEKRGTRSAPRGAAHVRDARARHADATSPLQTIPRDGTGGSGARTFSIWPRFAALLGTATSCLGLYSLRKSRVLRWVSCLPARPRSRVTKSMYESPWGGLRGLAADAVRTRHSSQRR